MELSDKSKKKNDKVSSNPKDLIIEQEVEMMENMTEGQLAEYLAENFDY